jgi:hypothetical protein
MPVQFTETYFLFIAISLVLPVVVAFVTKRASSPTVKANVLLALSIINGVLVTAHTAAASGNNFGLEDWKSAALGAIISFAIAVAIHAGYLKPSGITGTDGEIQKKVPLGLI